ncbi:beta-ketoacyl synthase N-terminal-like domain-containing protein [Amycolatopsis magusensis]|uniref:beta-ketoacyl synthase N-terminal-like domain-containing protein n=1 Tax=Amycolatopsis magusensis TaxID=882444 RepID=UPI003C2F080C
MELRRVRVGLPQLSVGGLSENWLFKEFGDLHWQLLQDRFGRSVTELRDAAGQRLLPAFVRIRLTAEPSLRAFAEGDECRFTGELGQVDEHSFAADLAFDGPDGRVSARLLTVFVRRGEGNLLSPGVPEPPAESTPPTAEHLEFQRGFLAARGAGRTGKALFTSDYRLNPYHDLNGAGLLYFASYPHLSDHGEREYLRHSGRGGDWAVDAATVSRDVLYLGNCGPDDEVRISQDACDFSDGDSGLVHLAATLTRASDGGPLARITTTKLIAESAPAPVRPRENLGSGAELAARLQPMLAAALDLEPGEFTPDTDLRRHGLDSFALTTFAAAATEALGAEVDPSRLFQAFSVADIAAVLTGETRETRETRAPAQAEPVSEDAIAVIGMAGRFPGADSVDELWQVLDQGRETIGEVPADRWDWRALRAGNPGLGDRIPARGGFLRDIRRFDHAFFHISPREAELMDPQQRLFLEVAWAAFEEAGYDVTGLDGSRIGVFAGACHQDYAALLREHLREAEPHQTVATSFSIIPNRVSYAFGFGGKSVAVDTLCSSSLVALEQAVRALRAGECAQALVGGVNVICDPAQHVAYARAGVLSQDGRVRTFDADANGYVRGEGVCALVLKPLAQARADGDHVHGVIRGVAVNHGGTAQSLTAPNADAQAELVVRAHTEAGAGAVGHLEAHGTGTVLGDPIEVGGLTAAFERLASSGEITLGSVKTNIGHLESAAGLAGVIKVLLAMRHRVLPGTVNFQRLNGMIKLDGTPFRVRSRRSDWTGPLRAGVSSFGMGGTNAHVVLEADTAPEPATTVAEGTHLVPLSAKTPEALTELAANLFDFLGGEPPALPDLAYTAQVGRAAMAERVIFAVASLDELRTALERFLAGQRPVDLPEPAQRWLSGEEVDWAAAYSGGPRPRRVSLPTYPFRRDQHWIVPEPPKSAGTRLVKEWTEAPAEPASRPDGVVLVLAGQHTPALVAALGPGFRATADGERVAGVLDCTALTEESSVDERAALLRGVLAAGPAVVLQFTRGLQAFRNPGPRLAGARAAGLYRVLGAEFPSVTSRTVDLDFGIEDLPRLAAAIIGELAVADRETEICHRDGVRYRPVLVPAPAGTGDPLAGLAGGAVVITGGTGGIGLELAGHLAGLGVRELVLLGRTPLPPRAKWAALAADETTEPELREKLRALTALLGTGVGVQVRTHGLDSAATLKGLFTRLRRKAGAITGFFHCAGTIAEAGSFLYQPEGLFADLAAAKCTGLDTVWAAFGAEKPRLTVVCSSISAAVPRLGASHTAYAAANAYLDFFAAAHDGRDGRIVRSLQWPLWTATGMGRHLRSGSAALGIPDLRADEALDLLADAVATDAPVVLPCHATTADFGDLLRVTRPERKAPARVAELVARVLKTDLAELPTDATFTELGVDSLLLAELVRVLEDELGRPVDPSLVQEHPTIDELTEALGGERPAPVVPASAPAVAADDEIAVIGMACRFPGAPDPAAFWQNLLDGRDSITEVPADRWDVAALYSPDGRPGTSISKWGGFLDDAAEFDPDFFGFDERTAGYLDPLVRKALEVSAECFRDAGYADEEVKGRRVGVFLGSRTANYREYLRPLPREAIVGLNQNFVGAHVSHFFDLTGPNLVVDTACSSSLVSVHLAVQSLRSGESELALAGGVDLLLDEDPYLLLSEGKALSPTGRCRTFDSAADGFVPGEGCGVVLLKPLAAARRDGDRVLAVLSASAVNNDGRTMGYTTPSGRAQRALIQSALDSAGVDPRAVGYVETHGTGTMIGDPIELQALTAAYREHTAEAGYCAVGSVKSNIGHTLSAAGIAGLLKVVQVLRHQVVPPTLHCANPNPRFGFADSPFRPVTRLTPAEIEYAALSSFGFGGTNAHAILRRADTPAGPERAPLPAPAYRRRRFWFGRPGRPDQPAPVRRRSARLELSFSSRV